MVSKFSEPERVDKKISNDVLRAKIEHYYESVVSRKVVLKWSSGVL